MFNILDNLHHVDIRYSCAICGSNIVEKFTNSPYYSSVKDDDDAVIEYVEAHLTFDDLDKMSAGGNVTIELYSALCGNRECKRTQLRRNREDILKSIKVPLLFKDVPPVESLATEFADKLGIIYTGDVGVGKTYRAVATLKKFILSKGSPNKLSYKFINTCDLFLRMQEEIHHRRRTEKSIIKHCMDVDILVLDDLGTEKSSEWTEPNIYLLLNSRIENLKPTIVTSNLGKDDELSDKFNPRIASRLSTFNMRYLNGTDRRRC